MSVSTGDIADRTHGSMLAAGISIRPLGVEDITSGWRLSSALAWPHRREDWAALLGTGRGVGAWTADDRLIGTAIWWPWSRDFGTFGMMLVDPSWQGNGIGRTMLRSVLTDAGSRGLRLVATEAALSLYQPEGFVAAGRVCQHEGRVDQRRAPPRHANAGIRAFVPADRVTLLALDAAGFGTSRDRAVGGLLNSGSTLVLEEDGQITGFAVLREFGRGQILGPVVAASEGGAIRLVAAGIARSRGLLRIDIRACARQLADWLTENGFPAVDVTTVMERNVADVHIRVPPCFALLSQSLG